MTLGKSPTRAIIPSSAEPIGQGGVLVTPVWLRFFNNLVGTSQPILSVTPTASPFAYTATAKGYLSISGGTISGITLLRSRVTIPVSGSLIPVQNTDVVTLTYSVSPTLSFIPS